jgi:hypothetical protein
MKIPFTADRRIQQEEDDDGDMNHSTHTPSSISCASNTSGSGRAKQQDQSKDASFSSPSWLHMRRSRKHHRRRRATEEEDVNVTPIIMNRHRVLHDENERKSAGAAYLPEASWINPSDHRTSALHWPKQPSLAGSSPRPPSAEKGQPIASASDAVDWTLLLREVKHLVVLAAIGSNAHALLICFSSREALLETKAHLNRILPPAVARAVTSMVSLATIQQSTELSTMARHIRRHLGWVYAPLWFRLLKEQCCTLTIYVRGGLSEHNPLLPTPAPAVSTFPPYLPTRTCEYIMGRLNHSTWIALTILHFLVFAVVSSFIMATVFPESIRTTMAADVESCFSVPTSQFNSDPHLSFQIVASLLRFAWNLALEVLVSLAVPLVCFVLPVLLRVNGLPTILTLVCLGPLFEWAVATTSKLDERCGSTLNPSVLLLAMSGLLTNLREMNVADVNPADQCSDVVMTHTFLPSNRWIFWQPAWLGVAALACRAGAQLVGGWLAGHIMRAHFPDSQGDAAKSEALNANDARPKH